VTALLASAPQFDLEPVAKKGDCPPSARGLSPFLQQALKQLVGLETLRIAIRGLPIT